MAEQPTLLQLRFYLNPVYWFTWLGIGLLYLSSLLPYRAMLALGTALGWLTYVLLPSRRRVTRTNLRLVFPEQSKQQINQLVRQSFYSTGIAIFESAYAWWASDQKIRALFRVEGLEHIEAARQQGKGILLLGGHYTTLEISGRFIAYYLDDVYPTYKPAHNPLFEIFMRRNREQMNKGLVASRDMRTILKILKQQQCIWYAPDQDFGTRQSIFAPFMGIQTATLEITSRLAARSGAAVVPYYSERLPGTQGYRIRFAPMLSHFPSGDDVKDATAINAAIEQQVRRTPGQYLWGHRRFKTRPPGEPQVYAHRRDRPLRRYSRALMLLSPLILGYTLWLAYRNRDLRYLRQRYGLFNDQQQTTDLWFHAASVGEVNAVYPLLLRIHEKYPQLRIALSTFTPTGGAIATKKLPAEIAQFYLPLDYEYAVQRVLNHLQPGCLIIMETELWPHLHQHCFNRGIPVIIINGRLSDKSYQSKGWLHHLMCRSIEFSHYILARTETDRQRFIDMVARENKVEVPGNIKFAIDLKQPVNTIELDRPYVLAASTHEEEEQRLAQIWQQRQDKQTLLVIAPRHPHRSRSIQKQLKALGLNIAVRSLQQPVTAKTEIYLADTFGELAGFIAGSRLVFMGGTLVKTGGHNILEVGAQARAVIFGPHMQNFADERDLFLQNDAAIEVSDDAMLAEQFDVLLANPSRCQQLGDNARALLVQQQHVLDDYLNILERVCPVLQAAQPADSAEPKSAS